MSWVIDGKETTGTYDAGGDIEIIPDKTRVLAMIDDAKWAKDPHFNEYINLRYTVVKPDEYANRKVWQKLWVADDKPEAKDAVKKRNNDLRMLGAIDANCGGRIQKKFGPDQIRDIEDEDLALALTNKPMTILLRTWKQGDSEGNWVAAVGPKAEYQAPAATPKKISAGADFDEETIPF